MSRDGSRVWKIGRGDRGEEEEVDPAPISTFLCSATGALGGELEVSGFPLSTGNFDPDTIPVRVERCGSELLGNESGCSLVLKDCNSSGGVVSGTSDIRPSDCSG